MYPGNKSGQLYLKSDEIARDQLAFVPVGLIGLIFSRSLLLIKCHKLKYNLNFRLPMPIIIVKRFVVNRHFLTRTMGIVM